MAAWQKESGSAKGRSFGTTDGVPGFLNRLKAWIVKVPASGGPGWYIIDDETANPTNPHIVCSNVSGQPTNASRSKIVRFGFSANAGVVTVDFYMHRDVTANTNIRQTAGYTIETTDLFEYGYDFRGGPECLLLMTNISGNWDWAFIDEWEGDPLFVEDDFTATLQQDWGSFDVNDGGNQVSEFWRMQGYGPHLDANGKLYVSVTVNAGPASQIFIYNNPARTSEYLIAQTTNSSSIGTVGLTTMNNSGVTGSIRRNAITATDTDIEIDMCLYTGTGEGALFTVGKWYYIWDYATGDRTGYFKVLAIVTDKLVVDSLFSGQIFSAGACISPYGHRWAVWGNTTVGQNGSISGNPQIPYMSNPVQPYVGNSFTNIGFSTMLTSVMNPNDEGKYAVMRPVVYENGDWSGQQTTMNRAYGQLKNIYISHSSGLAQMQFGRVINSKNYLCFHISGTTAYLILDTTSLS